MHCIIIGNFIICISHHKKCHQTLADLSNYQPTQFQPVGLCKKSTGNQSCSNPHMLVFVKPTVIPTMCFEIRRMEQGWFLQNQPSFQLYAMIYKRWNAVSFRKTNRRLSYMRVGTRLIFLKPTVIPTVGIPVWWLKISWFRVDFFLKSN